MFYKQFRKVQLRFQLQIDSSSDIGIGHKFQNKLVPCMVEVVCQIKMIKKTEKLWWGFIVPS